MKKQLLAFALALACAVGTFGTATVAEQPVTVEAATKKAPTLSKVYNAVKKAYGKDYLPNIRLKKDEIKTRYGISSSWYNGVVAEVPMISAQADELVIVKAKNAETKKKIKSALVDYRKWLQEESFQYPMNAPKVKAAKIYVKGDYVCLFVLGTIDQKIANGDDEAKKVEAYKTQNAKAVKAMRNLYK